jgi:hypothetical protein
VAKLSLHNGSLAATLAARRGHLSEEVTVRLLVSSVATIGGVAMVFARRAAASP